MATSPAYAATPLLDYCQVSAANTNRDGTGTTVLLGSGTAAGKRVTRCSIQSTGTTTAGAVRLYVSTDSGTTKRLIVEKVVPAITPAVGTTPPFYTTVPEIVGLVLPGTTAQIYASTNNAETFNLTLESA